MYIAIFLFLTILFGCFSSFVLWRRMRIDYQENQVLGFSFALLVAMLVFGWAGSFVDLAIWGGLFGGFLVTLGFCKSCRWDVWDLLDTVIFLSFGFGTLYYVFFGNWWEVLASGVGGLIVFIVQHSYRHWNWYKSGKTGIVGCIGLCYWGLVNVGSAWPSLLLAIGAVVSVISVVAIVLRSRVS